MLSPYVCYCYFILLLLLLLIMLVVHCIAVHNKPPIQCKTLGPKIPSSTVIVGKKERTKQKINSNKPKTKEDIEDTNEHKANTNKICQKRNSQKKNSVYEFMPLCLCVCVCVLLQDLHQTIGKGNQNVPRFNIHEHIQAQIIFDFSFYYSSVLNSLNAAIRKKIFS